MANWHFGSKRNWYLNFGPYVGFLVDAEDSEFELDLKDAFNSIDFGLALGIGYKFEISDRTKLYIEYDGQAGLSDIFEDNSGDAVRNNRSSLNLGVFFKL
jgi:opacity protein-like surface antigen